MLFPTCGNLLFANYYVRKILHNRLFSAMPELSSEPKSHIKEHCSTQSSLFITLHRITRLDPGIKSSQDGGDVSKTVIDQ